MITTLQIIFYLTTQYFLSFFLSFWVWPLSIYSLLSVQRYCCIWSHSMTHTHSVELLWMRDRPIVVTSWEHKPTSKGQTYQTLAGFERTIPAKERPQTHAFDRAATGMGLHNLWGFNSDPGAEKSFREAVRKGWRSCFPFSFRLKLFPLLAV